MYEMSKEVLEKVSFDKLLFRKELSKFVNWMRKEEALLLKTWCLATFGHLYKDVIIETFDKM